MTQYKLPTKPEDRQSVEEAIRIANSLIGVRDNILDGNVTMSSVIIREAIDKCLNHIVTTCKESK